MDINIFNEIRFLYTIIPLIETGILILIFTEFFYSYKKQDGIYSASQTISNLFTGKILLRLPVFTISMGVIASGLGASGKATVTLFSCLATIVLADFVDYIYHYIHHKYKYLWLLGHAVHHNDDHFNLTTSFRNPVIRNFYVAIITNVPLLLLGVNFNVLVLANYIIGVHQTICHSEYIKFPRVLEYVFISPRLHKIHHDQNEKHQNSNYGKMFSIWDRVFGTLVEDIDWNEYKAGVKGYRQNNIIFLQTDPFVNLIKSLK